MIAQALTPLKEKYLAMPERDRRALLILGIFLLPALLYFALVFPVQRAHSSLSQQLEAKQADLQWMQESAAKMKSMRGSNVGGQRQGRGLSQLVSDSAPRYQLQISRIQPRGDDEIQVWLEDAPFDQLVHWLHQSEQDFGLVVASINMTAGKNPGWVKMQVKFKG